MKTLLLSYDVEQFPAKEFGIPLEEDVAFENGRAGLGRLADLLCKRGWTSTFFVTSEFAERYMRDLRALLKDGHELAMHGVSHDDHYERMQPAFARDRIGDAHTKMESMFKTRVHGFRGPRMSRPPYAVLRECGFTYDSSLHPTWIPGRYNHFLSRRSVHEKDGITIVPVSVTPLLRMPASWVWFRSLGLSYAQLCSRLAAIDQDFLHLYWHPWEFAESPVSPFGVAQRIVFGGCGESNLQRFARFVEWAERRGFVCSTITNYLARESKEP